MKKIFIIILALSLALLINRCGGGASSVPPASIPVAIEGIEGSTDVAVNSSFVYEFDSAINTLTVKSTNFFILPTPSSANLTSSGKAVYDETTCAVTNALNSSVRCPTSTLCVLDPTLDLSADTSYTICISPSIEYAHRGWSPLIREAHAANNFAGASFTFTTAGESIIPDVAGVYSSSDEECLESMVLMASGTDNIYNLGGGDTLTMTDSTTCSFSIEMKEDESGTEFSCSYEANQFTISMTLEGESCTSVFTKTDITCGDGTCDYEYGENLVSCTADCAVITNSISFLDDHSWSTTSPTDDCLADATGASISFNDEPESAEEEEAYETFFADLGDYFIRVNRHLENSSCFVRFERFDGEGDVDGCIYISACNSNSVSAVCELTDGGYCNIDLE